MKEKKAKKSRRIKNANVKMTETGNHTLTEMIELLASTEIVAKILLPLTGIMLKARSPTEIVLHHFIIDNWNCRKATTAVDQIHLYANCCTFRYN